MNAENIAQIKVGSALKQVQQTLAVTALPTQTIKNGQTYFSYEYDSCGIGIFFDDHSLVKSIIITAPCNTAIRGISIGMNQDQVFSILGAPTRYWPIRDGVDRWIYDTDEFMRVDFDPDSNLVRRIVR